MIFTESDLDAFTQATMANQQWMVSVNGADVGDVTALVTDSVVAPAQIGSRVCVRPASASAAGEDACASVGTTCVQSISDISSAFARLGEIQSNPGGQGIILVGQTTSTFALAVVYVKDYCYTIRENDFQQSLDGELVAEVRFSLQV